DVHSAGRRDVGHFNDDIANTSGGSSAAGNQCRPADELQYLAVVVGRRSGRLHPSQILWDRSGGQWLYGRGFIELRNGAGPGADARLPKFDRESGWGALRL